MDLITCARPYAKAAFLVSTQTNEVKDWLQFLGVAHQVCLEEKVRRLLVTPEYSTKEKAELFGGLFGDLLTEQKRNFIYILSENARLMLLPQIAVIFKELYLKYENTTRAEVFSAFSLNKKQKERLVKKLSQKFNQQIILTEHIDSKLIGGLIIKVGDLVIDGSIRSKLKTMANILNS